MLSNGLYIIDVDAGSQTPLTVASGNSLDLQPTWSRSTVLFVFVSSGVRVEHGDIYIQRGVTSKLRLPFIWRLSGRNAGYCSRCWCRSKCMCTWSQ